MFFRLSFCILLSLSLTEYAYGEDKPLRIAVAANFTPALKKLLVEFHQQTNIDTQVISGATGALYLQIKHGAPFDIFISADSTRPKQLEQEGLVLANSRQTYALGQLALLSMHSTVPLNDLKKIPSRFAIANPDTAPYGKAAKQTLEYLKLWSQYQPKLIQGININQTFAQVRSQAVTLGFVANSQLVLNKLTGVVVPTHYHQPIAQQLVIIKNSRNISKAKRLSEYLLTPSVQNKIVDFGYARFTHDLKGAALDES
ncbi:MAG: molybdate ABC transporter substrate-binding protein [Colwellia sp.]|nr:molybdate ABC transporter substrate-binding protein [Colwellia sp.]MCW8864036.1 molybdate ABC transporter substrate-binding protein [Colwellia sp.]MCW9083042.1 molybdate ABC transporter substrate-binding protein [Colwellia sp.]